MYLIPKCLRKRACQSASPLELAQRAAHWRGSPVLGYGPCVHGPYPDSPAKPATVATPDPAAGWTESPSRLAVWGDFGRPGGKVGDLATARA